MDLIEQIKDMLFKKVLYTEKQVFHDPIKGNVTEYSSKIFLSNLNAASRRVEPEIIAITDEYVYNAKNKKKVIEEFNLVNIYSGALDEQSDKGDRFSRLYLENSSVDTPRLPSLKAELHKIEVRKDMISWREVYTLSDNPSIPEELIESLNSEERVSRIYRMADGRTVLEYFGACVCVEPHRIDTGVKPYFYKFSAVEDSKK